MYSHSDVSLLDYPAGESRIFQGVTTDVVGNCGQSPFPVGRLLEGKLQAVMGGHLPSQHPLLYWDPLS